MAKRVAKRKETAHTGTDEEENNDCVKPLQTGSKNGFPAEIEKDLMHEVFDFAKLWKGVSGGGWSATHIRN